MDNAKVQFEMTEVQTQAEAVKYISELADLQLALIGGGHGEVINQKTRGELQMDNAKIEFVIEDQVQGESTKFVSELAEMQLALIGGGCGEVLF